MGKKTFSVGLISTHSKTAALQRILARIFSELPAATADMRVLPGVLGYRTLRRTVQVRLGSNPLRLPGTRRKRLRCAWHTLLHGLATPIREISGLGMKVGLGGTIVP